MAAIGDVLVKIKADISGLSSGLQKAEKRLQRSGRKLAAIGSELSMSLTLPIAAAGVASIKAAADFEKMEKSLASAMGSTELATVELGKLKEAALAPGLGFEQLVKGSVRLQSVGLDADTARTALQTFGNALALVGGTAADLDGVGVALAQIASKGKISAEEINQLAERVPQIRLALVDAFGTADTEVLQKMGIDFNAFIDGVTTSLGKLPQASNTLGNTFENMAMAVREGMADIGKSIANTTGLQEKIEQLTAKVVDVVKWFINLPEPVKKAAIKIALLTAALGPLLKVIGSFKSIAGLAAGAWASLTKILAAFIPVSTSAAGATGLLATAVNVLMGPIGLIVIAIGAVVAIFVAFYNKSEKFRKAMDDIASSIRSIARAAGDALIKLNPFLDAAQKAARMEERQSSRKSAPNSGGMLGDVNFLNDLAAKQKAAKEAEVVVPVGGDFTGLEEDLRTIGETFADDFNDTLSGGKFGESFFSKFEKAPDIFGEAKTAFLDFKGSFIDGVDQMKLASEDGKDPWFVDGDKQENLKTMTDGIMELSEEFSKFSGKVIESNTLTDEQMSKLEKGLTHVMNVTSEALSSGAKNFKGYARAALASIAQVIKGLIAQNAITVITASLKQFGFPGAVIGAVAAGALIATMNGIINKVQAPKLAKGGLAFGPTMAMVGDNQGARTNPEVIAPLDTLKKYLSNSGSGGGTFRIDYATLDLLLDMREERKARFE